MNVDLRDYLAAHAPEGQLAMAEHIAAERTGGLAVSVSRVRPDMVLLVRAEMAYAWADAMLTARLPKDPVQKAA